MSFDTEAELDIVIPRDQLSAAREAVEEELGSVAVGVSNPAAQSAQLGGRTDGGAGAGRDLRRLDEDRNEHLDDVARYLESIEDAVTEGGLLGGGAGGLATEILGIGGDFAAEGAGAAAETATGLATDVAGTALGQAAGSVIADEISGSTVSVEPNPLPVEGGGSGGTDVTLTPDIDFDPRFMPSFQPTINQTLQPTVEAPDVSVSPNIDLPDLNLGGGSNIQNPHPVVVENLDSFEPVSISVGGGSAPATSSGGGSSGRSAGELLEDSIESSAKTAASGAALGAIGGSAGGGVGALPGAIAGGIGGAIFGAGTPFVGEGLSRIQDSRSSSGDNTSQPPSSGVTVEVDHSPTYNVRVDGRSLERLVEDVLSDIEREHDRDIDELQREMDDLQGEIDDVRRNIRQRR